MAFKSEDSYGHLAQIKAVKLLLVLFSIIRLSKNSKFKYLLQVSSIFKSSKTGLSSHTKNLLNINVKFYLEFLEVM